VRPLVPEDVAGRGREALVDDVAPVSARAGDRPEELGGGGVARHHVQAPVVDGDGDGVVEVT
jgi:hypothetical protein